MKVQTLSSSEPLDHNQDQKSSDDQDALWPS